MPGQVPIPSPDVLADVLSTLIGREVTAQAAGAGAYVQGTPLLTAVYVSDTGEASALWICDLRVAGALGAALSMAPPGTANEAVAAGRLSVALEENFHEVANVCASAFNQLGTPHVKLASVSASAEGLPPDAKALLARRPRRVDLTVTVSGYGAGWTALVVA